MRDDSPHASVWTRRLRSLATSSILVAFAFVQHPGWIVPDTKLDLTANPGGLLARAFQLWDPSAAAGQLQNQAYGYLFPMGPFFWLGDSLGMPSWVVQRLWWAVVLLVAFHGAHLLLSRLGIGSSSSRLIAAFVFALAPRMLIGLGAVSSEIWPMALTPWVVLPLVRVDRGDVRGAALRSGCVVLLVGAVNATATLAAVIPAGLWILTRSADVRRTLLGWWLLSVALASVWWIGPLLLLGRYSPPFLDWIEAAAVTTAPASLPEALRGTTQWIAGIRGTSGPLWLAGFEVVTSPIVVAMGLVVAVVGLGGLWRAPRVWADYARVLLLTGLVLVTLGRVGPMTGLGAEHVANWLDGALTPLRNTHKFEPLVRLALVMGLAHALPAVQAGLRLLRAPWPRLGYAVVILALVAQTAAPALTGVSQRGRYLDIPAHWEEAAQWLSRNPAPGRTLVVPGSNAASSVWGDPRDEPLQAVGETPWIVRDGVPLGSAGATRLLNDIEARIASGYGGDELAGLLRRLGISRVILRADLVDGEVPPIVARHALVTAGAVHAESFGGLLGGSADPAVARSYGMDRPFRAIEILDLESPGAIRPDGLIPTGELLEVSGGPESVALLPGAAGPTLLSSDSAGIGVADPRGGVLTDTLARREATFSRVRDQYGPLLTAEEPYSAARGVHDWFPPWLTEATAASHQTTREWLDGVTADASSALTQPGLGQSRDPGAGPERAFDRSGDTAWQSAGFDPEGQWVEVSWPDPVDLPALTSAVIDPVDGADVAAFVVTTESGEARTPVSPPVLVEREDEAKYELLINVPPGPTTWFRLEVADVRNNRPTVRVWDVGAGDIPRAEPWSSMPSASAPIELVTMSIPADGRQPCARMSSGVVVCNPSRARTGEQAEDLRRTFFLPEDGHFRGVGTVFPRASAATEVLLERLDGIVASASSQWFAGAAVSAQLALDGDERTYWASDPADPDPTLSITWPEPRLVTGVRLSTDSDVAGRRPTEVSVTLDNGEPVTVAVQESGFVPLRPQSASEIALAVTQTTEQRAQTAGSLQPMPVVIGELAISGRPWARLRGQEQMPVGMPCGFGPEVQVGGQAYPTSVHGTRGDLIAGEALRLTVCEPVAIPAGPVRARVIASAEFAPRGLQLAVRDLEQSPPHPMTVERWTAALRTVTVDTPSTLR